MPIYKCLYHLFAALVSTGIMSRFGARAVVILGTVFMTSGMASSAFAQNLFALKISMGVLTGEIAECHS